MPHTVASPAQGSLAENSFYHSAENHADVTSSYGKRLKNSDPVVILEPLTVSTCICEVSLLSKKQCRELLELQCISYVCALCYRIYHLMPLVMHQAQPLLSPTAERYNDNPNLSLYSTLHYIVSQYYILKQINGQLCFYILPIFSVYMIFLSVHFFPRKRRRKVHIQWCCQNLLMRRYVSKSS